LTTKVTVSAKIDSNLRKKLAELGIKPSEIINRALEEAVKKKQRKGLIEEVGKISNIINRTKPEEWVSTVRDDRDER